MDLTPDDRLTLLKLWLQDHFNMTDLPLETVSGDASFRRYYRFYHNDISYIAVDAPPDKEDSHPFVELSVAYAKQGLLVPEVIHVDFQQGLMCLSDLGDELLLGVLNQHTVDDYYEQALMLLAKVFQVTSGPVNALPLYDANRLREEMLLFTDWLLPRHLELKLSAPERTVIDSAFEILIDSALDQPYVGVHRDYHCRNLMVVDGQQLALIDYQDAVVGPITYDAVSLLRDCYIRWPDELVYRHVLAFKRNIIALYPEFVEVSDETFIRWFDLMGMQRHIKVCGIFARLYYRDGKEGYLADIPRVLDYVIDVGSKYPDLAEFIHLVKTKVQPLLLEKAQ